jgi:hypothetical protein
MGVLAMAKRLIAGVDELVADAAAEIDRATSEAVAASEEIRRLEAEETAAADYPAAAAIDEQIRRLPWSIDRAAARLPGLEARLAAAKAEKQRRARTRHKSASAALWSRLRRAVEEAARVQVEVINARDAAITELGEHLVNQNLPHLAFRGLILPDLVQLWVNEMERLFSAPINPGARPQPTPAPGPASKAVPGQSRPVTERPGRGVADRRRASLRNSCRRGLQRAADDHVPGPGRSTRCRFGQPSTDTAIVTPSGCRVLLELHHPRGNALRVFRDQAINALDQPILDTVAVKGPGCAPKSALPRAAA